MTCRWRLSCRGGLFAATGVQGTIGGLIGTMVTALIGAVLLIWLSSRVAIKSS